MKIVKLKIIIIFKVESGAFRIVEYGIGGGGDTLHDGINDHFIGLYVNQLTKSLLIAEPLILHTSRVKKRMTCFFYAGFFF